MSRNLIRVACCALAPVIGALALWGTTAVAAAETPSWYESVEGGTRIKTNKEMKWTNGKLELSDNKFGTSAKIACSDAGSGVVEPTGAGEITKWTISSCHSIERCESPTVVAEHLPWTTQLTYVGTSIVNTFKGSPELRWFCGGVAASECPIVKFPTLSNLEKGVNELFTNEPFTCLFSNTGSSRIEGARTLELTNGKVLSVK
jgi:hypothetical protein